MTFYNASREDLTFVNLEHKFKRNYVETCCKTMAFHFNTSFRRCFIQLHDIFKN